MTFSVVIQNIPFQWSRESLKKLLEEKLNVSNIHVVSFKQQNNRNRCILKLPSELDVKDVLKKLELNLDGCKLKPKFLPENEIQSKKNVTNNSAGTSAPKDHVETDNVLVCSHHAIMQELQSKYTGLFSISKKTNHKLLENIAEIILKRLKDLISSNRSLCSSALLVTSSYRRMHPHFGDFQMILSTLHKIEDASGTPRTQLNEADLTSVIINTYTYNNLPLNKVQMACDRYSERILKKVTEHISQLNTDISEVETEEEVARRRVREEMKNLQPYLPYLIKQVISHRIVPTNIPNHSLRIYGEPAIPQVAEIRKLLEKYDACNVKKCSYMFNCIEVYVPSTTTGGIVAIDGTIIDGNRLVIRQANIPLFTVPDRLVNDMENFFAKVLSKP